VPAAHAYSTWGVRYPPVTVRIDLPGCDRGSGCPGGAGFKTPQDVEAIGKGCLSQALTPQNVNSRCL